MENCDYTALATCKKTDTYAEKVKRFDNNVTFTLNGASFINKNTKLDFSEIYKLFHLENVMVAKLSIFKYNEKTMCFAIGNRNEYKYGKYEILTISEINNYLNENYIIFIKSISDLDYDVTDNLKYCVVVFK